VTFAVCQSLRYLYGVKRDGSRSRLVIRYLRRAMGALATDLEATMADWEVDSVAENLPEEYDDDLLQDLLESDTEG